MCGLIWTSHCLWNGWHSPLTQQVQALVSFLSIDVIGHCSWMNLYAVKTSGSSKCQQYIYRCYCQCVNTGQRLVPWRCGHSTIMNRTIAKKNISSKQYTQCQDETMQSSRWHHWQREEKQKTVSPTSCPN